MEWHPSEIISNICRRLSFFNVFSRFIIKLGFFIFLYNFLNAFFCFQILQPDMHVIGVNGLQFLQVSSHSFSMSGATRNEGS